MRVGARSGERRRIYLDGNSLGPPAPGTADAIAAVVAEEWAGDLIGAWNDGLVGPAR